MRGLSAGSNGTQSGGSITGFPNVAIYLDDQSGQLPGRNLDVYAADLERIEVLEGPQGTLFGAGAQAGVIRYITNKPKMNVTEGSVSAGYGITAGGDPNTDLTAVINLPLIADTLAVRGVIYNDRRGGYINNVPATFTRKDSDLGIDYANYPAGQRAMRPRPAPRVRCRRTASPINNNAIAARAINPVTYQGTARVRSVGHQFGLECPDHSELPGHGRRKACSTRCRTAPTASRCPSSRSRCSTIPSTRTNSRIPPGPSTGGSAISKRCTPERISCAM